VCEREEKRERERQREKERERQDDLIFMKSSLGKFLQESKIHTVCRKKNGHTKKHFKKTIYSVFGDFVQEIEIFTVTGKCTAR